MFSAYQVFALVVSLFLGLSAALYALAKCTQLIELMLASEDPSEPLTCVDRVFLNCVQVAWLVFVLVVVTAFADRALLGSAKLLLESLR